AQSSPNSPGLTSIAAQSPFYRAQAANMSNASFASGASNLCDERAYVEDYTQVTQIQQIAGKPGFSKTVHNFLPRRLSRTKSASMLTPVTEANLVIGVSVQQSTTESLDSFDSTKGIVTTVTISAPGSDHAHAKLHNKSSRRTLSAAAHPGAKWLAKARSIASNLRIKAKSQAPLMQNVPS
ncbi:hypothetical protein AN958_00145, partial [Leucoagaricus sp. SymC.cos]